MKLHLPHTLRTALLCTFSLLTTLGTSNLYAGGMHSQVSLVTYTDFGQNMGRYRVEGVNALLSSIRQEEGGVVITYIEGHDDYTMDTPMPSFESQGDNGAYAAIGYNYIATVDHNGVQNPVFTGRYINGSDSLHYYGVEYRYSQVFHLQAASPDHSATHDYKVTRLSRLITDVTPGTPMPRFNGSDIPAQLKGRMEYRSGSGRMSVWDLDGYSTELHGAYDYAIGAMRLIDWVGANQYGFFSTKVTFDPSQNGISADDPLPFSPFLGDSGSPVWVWDDGTRSYLYMGSYQAISGRTGIATGAIDFTWDALEKFDKAVAVNGSTVHIKGVTATDNDEVVTDDTYTTRLHLGRVTDAGGSTITTYVGVKGNGNEYINTWLNLAPEKEKASWFAYDSKYYNVGSGRALNTEDLFFNSNLVFKASSAKGNVVEVDEDTDLGIGYLQFAIDPESGLDHAEYTLQSHGTTDDGHGGQRDYMVNSAGFVVEGGVDLHVKLTNTQWDSDANDYYYREWRKVGDGDLYLEGRGSNQILLNVGGSGTTYLRETDGYAAYNVYVGSGATVVTESLDQIARDFTFGYYGGTLDIRGEHAMDWYRTNTDVPAQGFSINSFSEDSYITNSQAGTTLTLTYREGGDTEYLGSFVDTEDGGAVRIRFNAGTGSTTTLRSIHTDLTHQKGEWATGSAVFVDSGKVVLEGSNTMHGLGSENGRNTARYSSTEDWHYADMAGDVHVNCDAEFELGSHARLTGDVYVYTGGTLIIREGVHSTYEYIEGGQRLEDTTSAFYRQFYGLHGNIDTDAGTEVRFEYSAGTTAEQVYSGNFTGTADVYMDLGAGGASLRLSGTNTFSGTKFLSGGGLISDNGLDALGSISTDDQRWLMTEDAFIAASGVSGEDLLGILSRDSQGMLALTQDQETDLNPQGRGYNALFIGALTGNDVRYGTRDAALATATVDGHRKWLLGGGGGNLIVDGLLQDADAELVLGNGYTSGTVTLTNVENIIGSITFKGRVTLAYTDAAALGGNNVRLDYTRRMLLADAADTSHVTEGSQGVVLVDKLDGAAPDMRGHAELYIGASNDAQLNGAPQIDDGASYRFGGIDGTLTVNAELADAGGRPTGLVVDGQTYSGGELVLTQAASITGDVVVRGYDADLLPAGEQRGDITLNLTCDNALADAASITLQDGTYVKLNGTSQTFRNLNAAAGSVIASALGTGALNVVVDSQAQVDVDGELHFDHLVKQGEGTLTLTGANTVHVYDVLGGALRAASVDSLYASTVNVLGGTSVSFTGSAKGTADTLVNLYEGSELHSESGADVTLQRGLKFLGNATITGPGKISVTTSEFGVQDLTVTLKDANVAISENGTFHQRGTIHAEGNSTLSISGGDNLRVFDHLEVAANSTLTLQQTKQETAPTFRIHDVDGSGKLVLDACNYKADAAHYIFDLDTDFAGTVTFQAHQAHSDHKYMFHMVIQSDNALACAQVEIGGVTSDNGIATLGIDTNNAAMQGLRTLDGSNNRAVLMAGYTESGAVERPVSTRRATLTILGSESKDFKGIVSGGAEGTDNGLSIVMNGTGVQTFSGVSVFNDVSALRGTLKITNTSADSSIKGDLTVARGANLTIGKALTLDDGRTLHVAGDAADASASLNATLTLAGGTIDFSGTALGSDSAALSAFSHGAGSVTIAFSDTYGVEEMKEYFLAGGDWQGVAVTGGAHPYLDADFRATSGGLYATLCARAGSHVWAGTAGSRTWNASHFGPDELEFSETDNAVFTDAAQEKAVDVAYSGSIASLVFDNSQEYTVNSIGGTVTADTLRQMGCGTTVVNGGVAAGTLMLEAGELRVRDTALLDAASSISGPGTLSIELGEGAAVNLPALDEDGIGALRLVSGTLNATGTLNVTREVFVEENATLNSSTAAFLKSGASLHLAGCLKIDSASSYALGMSLGTSGETAGRLVITGGGTATVEDGVALNLAEVSIEGGAMLVKRNGSSERNIGTLSLAGGTEFRLHGSAQPTAALEFAALKLTGATATVANQNNSEAMLFRSLSGIADSTTLNLVKRANSTKITIFEFGGAQNPEADFTGKLALSSTDTGGRRSAVIVLDDAQVAVNASIELASARSEDAILGLGVNADTVNIAGLASASALGARAIVFSGGVEANADSTDTAFTGDGVDRELVITTAVGADHSYHGAIGQNVSLTIGGHGTQRFIGEGISADLNLVGGETVLSLAQYAGHATVGTGAELRFEGEHTVVSNLIKTDGAVTLAGDNAVLELADDGDLVFNGFCYRDIDGNESPDGNGFAQGGSVQIFNLGEHASVNLGTASIVYQGDTLALDANGVAWRGEKSSRSYTVRNGVVTYDEAFATKAATLEIEGFILSTALEETPAELELTEDLKDDILIHSIGNGGILRLGENATLSASQLDAQASIKLAGAGRLELAKDATALPQGVGMGQDWTGTVAVSGVSFAGVFTCAQLGTPQSWVELKGTKGYLNNNSPTVANNLILATGEGGWAFEQNNGNDGSTVKFTGKLKGDGNIGRSNEAGSTYTYEFSGDIHEWTGSFISRNRSGKYTTFRVSGDATEVNANLLLGNPDVAYNDFRLEVKNNARFNGRVEVNSITVASGASATLAGNTSISKGIANSGTLTNEGTLELGNITSWSGTLVNAAQGNVVITSKLTAGTIDNSGTIIISDLMVGTDARYMDAHGQSSGNGFATSNLDVCAIGVIQNHGGTIVYGNRDVTAEVLGTGHLQDATAQTAYHVNSTDNTVSFSVIDAAADEGLGHIIYANGTALKVDNTADGRHLHSSQLSGTGTITLQLQDGAVLEMDSAFTATLEVSSAATATLHVTENAAISSLEGAGQGRTLDITGDNYAQLTVSNSKQAQFSGICVGDGAYVVLANKYALGNYANAVTIGEGGTVDVHGTADAKYVYTLGGGLLTNTGGNIGNTLAQTSGLVLTADSRIGGTGNFHILSGNYVKNTVKLNNFTLTKEGGNTLGFVSTTLDAGTLRVVEGALDFNSGNKGSRDVLKGTRIVLADTQAGNANKVQGTVDVDGSAEITAEEHAQISLNLYVKDNATVSLGAGDMAALKHTGALNGGASTTLAKTGQGAVELSGSMSGFSGSIDAQEGILNICNQSALRVQDVVLADGATVGAYTTVAADEMNEATLTISGTLAAKGADGKLNANLVMESGSTLDVRDTGGAGLLMGSEVTLSKGLTLNDYSSEWATWKDGTTYTLFTGVDGLDIGNGVTTGTMDYTQWVDAKEYFDNIKESNRYFLCFGGAPDQNAQGVLTAANDGSNVGMVYIMTMPEPTTSTLSLLALAALAARRRRK